jgi:hypothetical protein
MLFSQDEIQLERDFKVEDIPTPVQSHTVTAARFNMETAGDGIPQTANSADLQQDSSIASISMKSKQSAPSIISASKTSAALSSKTKGRSAKLNKTNNGGNNVETVKPLRVMSTVREEDGHRSGHDLFSASTEPDAKICVDILKGKCSIRDYEYNCFEMDLGFTRRKLYQQQQKQPTDETESPAKESEPVIDSNDCNQPRDVHNKPRESPMDVMVLLAGEVSGLKPPAVARFPKAPRLFVINRDGDATEVVRFEFILTFGLEFY